jgi:glycosyltransferase involved in cell wall biosynthesis
LPGSLSRKKMGNRRILLIGPFAPPIGGVSIHLKRLSKLIENDFDIDFIDESRSIKNDFFNIRSFKLVQYFRKIKKSDLIYVHSGSNILRIFHLVIGCITSKKIILTIHSYPNKKKFFLRYIDEFFFKLANTIIIVNSEILGRVSIQNQKCIVQSAFLPPIMETEPDLPANVSDWITIRKNNGKVIICANAWQLRIFNNQDLYGLDMCIDVASKLIGSGFPTSFVFNVSSLDGGENLYVKYQSIVEKLDLRENFLLLNENLSFVRLIEQADIVLRPTNTDGDALTVREALYLRKPIIASDIVKRPSGTIHFKSRDANDLRIKIIEIINKETKVPKNQLNRCEKEYRMFYSELIVKTLNMNKQ